jgi:endoglucanase
VTVTGSGPGFSPTAVGASVSPLAGMRFYVNPNSAAAQQERLWQSSQPANAAQMAKIAAQPTAVWFGDWNSDVTSAVSATVNAAAAAGEVAALVAYDIPQRDCGGYSSGGATSASAYRAWIRSFAAGIGGHPAVVILEPDAIAGLDCLSGADQATRLSLLSDAVTVLSALPGVHVYLDGGHAGWQPVSVIAARLTQANVAVAAGFSLNVSNFDTTASETTYGQSISAALGGKHFVIDTSRNGLGGDGQWCNPPGRALGARPTATTGNPLVDALLWIKYPGQSDGTCNGGPSAGTWWPAYALGLAQRAAY